MSLAMTSIIATRDMVRTRPDGSKVTITVQIGAPTQTPTGYVFQGWYCPVQFQGAPLPGVYVGMGVDSASALIRALTLPGQLLRILPFVNEIDYAVLPTFGFPEQVPIPLIGTTVSGTVQLEACNDPAQNITFEFRTNDGKPPTVIHQILTPVSADTGSFSIPGVPDGTYDLAIKGYNWLRVVLPGVMVAGADVSGLSVSCLGGDINNDNIIDTSDFNILSGEYGQMGDP